MQVWNTSISSGYQLEPPISGGGYPASRIACLASSANVDQMVVCHGACLSVLQTRRQAAPASSSCSDAIAQSSHGPEAQDSNNGHAAAAAAAAAAATAGASTPMTGGAHTSVQAVEAPPQLSMEISGQIFLPWDTQSSSGNVGGRRSALRSEFQSVDAVSLGALGLYDASPVAPWLIAAADASGRCLVGTWPGQHEDDGKQLTVESSPQSSNLHMLTSSSPGNAERFPEIGWSGVSILPDTQTQPGSRIAVSSYWGKRVTLYDVAQQTATKSWNCLLPPSAMACCKAYGSQESLIAVAEHNIISLYDPRSPRVVNQLDSLASVPFYAIAGHDSSGLFAAGGADKNAIIVDTRMWREIGRWKRMSKYEITWLDFVQADPRLIHVASLDLDLFCGEWSESGRQSRSYLGTLDRTSLRGDSRWAGVARVPGSEALMAMTESGSVFCVQGAFLMSGRKPSAEDPLSPPVYVWNSERELENRKLEFIKKKKGPKISKPKKRNAGVHPVPNNVRLNKKQKT